MTCAETFRESCCLVCITCGSTLDVSDFRLSGDSLCGHHACSLRRWGCSGEAAPAPVNYQLINSGSFLLVLVSACKRLLGCGIGGRHCDYGIRRKKKVQAYFFPVQGLIRCSGSLSASHLLRSYFLLGFQQTKQCLIKPFQTVFFLFGTVQKCIAMSFMYGSISYGCFKAFSS